MMERNSEGEKENHNEVEKIQLIDFSSEDDILVDYPFRDSLEDLRLSGSSSFANCLCNLVAIVYVYNSEFCVYII